MGKWHIGQWARKAFVWNTNQKPSQPVQGSKVVNERVMKIVEALKKETRQRGIDSGQSKCRSKLFELILPEVFEPVSDTHLKVGDVKDWAFACAQMIGLLAGMGLPPKIVREALKETTRIAEESAESSSAFMVKAIKDERILLRKSGGGNLSKEEKEEFIATPKVKPVTLASSPKEQVLQDLRRQLEMESDDAMKAALRGMIQDIAEGNGKKNVA